MTPETDGASAGGSSGAPSDASGEAANGMPGGAGPSAPPGAAPDAGPGADTVVAKNANEQLVLDFFVALSSGDLEALRPFLTERSVWQPMVRDIPGAGEYTGNQIIDDFLAPVRGMFRPGDPKVFVKALLSDGDMVAVESRSLGRLPDGRDYRNDYAWIFRLRDGKIARLHEYMDSHYVARLFGMDAA